MSKCLICGGDLQQFISFGKMPIANAFLNPSDYAREYFFELAVGFCSKCSMIQLMNHVQPEKMFHEEYAFFSSTSNRMANHFEQFSNFVNDGYLNTNSPFVVEIGSNDGIMLKNFASKGIKHLGIEPSANVAQVARAKGINTISRFFDSGLAEEIVAEYGQADAFLGANVMCHIAGLHSVVSGIKILLKPMGVLIFEDPYLGDIIEKVSYDQIYDEHAFYFSISSLDYIFAQHDMEIIDAIPQNVHGGSMRYVVANKGMKSIAKRVSELRLKEESWGVGQLATYVDLKDRIEKSRDELVNLLQDLKQKGKRVVGYGATSKSTTVLNYCGISTDLIEFISDTTPIKQGKFSPGMHIPIKPYECFSGSYPDYALLFAWNHKDEIMEKEKAYTYSGANWITYVPRVHII